MLAVKRAGVAVGDIVYLQDGVRPFSPIEFPRFREPWIVEAWLNREYHPARPGRPASTFCRGGHLAVVRSLRSGRRVRVADWLLARCAAL